MGLSLDQSIQLAREASEFPRNLQNWPQTPEEEEAEQVLEKKAKELGLSVSVPYAKHWLEIQIANSAAKLFSHSDNQLLLATTLAKKLMEFVKSGNFPKALSCINFIRETGIFNNYSNPFVNLDEILRNARSLGITDYGKEKWPPEKIKSIVRKSAAYLFTVAPDYAPERVILPAKIVSVFEEYGLFKIYKLILLDYPKKEFLGFYYGQKINTNEEVNVVKKYHKKNKNILFEIKPKE